MVQVLALRQSKGRKPGGGEKRLLPLFKQRGILGIGVPGIVTHIGNMLLKGTFRNAFFDNHIRDILLSYRLCVQVRPAGSLNSVLKAHSPSPRALTRFAVYRF